MYAFDNFFFVCSTKMKFKEWITEWNRITLQALWLTYIYSKRNIFGDVFYFPNHAYREMSIYKCLKKWSKIKPQFLSLLKLYCNSLVMSAMQISFFHKTIWLFVCLGFYVPLELENCSHTWIYHHYRWRASNFYLYPAQMAIEQWLFLSVPTCFDSGAVTTCFYDLGLSR